MNHSPDDIIKIENEKYYENNVIRSISIGLRATKDNEHILIVFGDILLNRHALDSINHNESCILISNHMSENEVGCNINNKGYLEYMMFDLPPWLTTSFITSKQNFLSLFFAHVIFLNRSNSLLVR